MPSPTFPTTAGRLRDEPRHQDLVGGSPRCSGNLARNSGEGALGVGESRLRAGEAHIGGHDQAHLLPKGFTVMIRFGSAKVRRDCRTRHRPDQLGTTPLFLRPFGQRTRYPVGENQAFEQ